MSDFRSRRGQGMLLGSMRSSFTSASSIVLGAVLFSAPAFAADKAFDEPKFGFTFSYDPTWIPAMQAEGESVTFTLSEGEVHVAVQRDPNARHHKSRAALGEDLVRTWKGRLAFDELEPVETKLGGVPATLVQGNGKLFDDPTPYRLSLYVVEQDSKLYTVKFSGLYEPKRGYWDGFSRLLRSFRFRESAPAPAPTVKARAAAPTPTPEAPPQSSAE